MDRDDLTWTQFREARTIVDNAPRSWSRSQIANQPSSSNEDGNEETMEIDAGLENARDDFENHVTEGGEEESTGNVDYF